MFNYATVPVAPETFFDVGGGYFDLQAPLADVNDSISATFFYPATITGMDEANLKLLYFNGTAYAPVKMNNGSTDPVRDPTDQCCSRGGFFAVTFDANSTPAITGLNGTIFTAAPAPFNTSPATLWPPDHRMVSVSVNGPAGSSIISVSSNEAETGTGSGDLAPDWQITGPLTVNLRAERNGSGSGRIYSVRVQCSDGTQNVGVVRAPHDKSNVK